MKLGRSDRDSGIGLLDEAGDTLIEVLVSALALAAIVVGTLAGVDASNRVTALERARSEADTLAQAAEDQLRSEPVSRLGELERSPRSEQIEQNHTLFTVASSAQYRSGTSGSASCAGGTASADYIETSTTVTWKALGAGRPVVERGLISPPPGTTLLVQVLDEGDAQPGMTATATGPGSSHTVHSETTSAAGCAIFSLLPGEYTANVSRTGYVTPDGYAASDEDPAYKSASSKFLVAETTATDTVEMAPAGELKVSFASAGQSVEGDSFVAANAAMLAPRAFGTVGSYHSWISTGRSVFPFPASKKYGVYAGSCAYDAPEAVGSEQAAEAEVQPGASTTVTAVLPPLHIQVMSGTGPSKKGVAVGGATARLLDTRCGSVREETTDAEGRLPLAGVPYGTYQLCVTGGSSGPAADRKYTTPAFRNDTAAGPSELSSITNDGGQLEGGYAYIYLGRGAAESPGTLGEGSSCP